MVINKLNSENIDNIQNIKIKHNKEMDAIKTKYMEYQKVDLKS